jgi:hypothetical protein
MAENGYKPPWVYLLVVFGTVDALDAVQDLGPLGGPERIYRRFEPILGHVFDRSASLAAGTPHSVEHLGRLVQSPKLTPKVKNAVQYFHDRYSHSYWDSETKIGTMLKLRPAELPYGLGGKGWTLVTHANCPNGSLPVLWYPHVGSPTTDIKALFPRLESQEKTESLQELHEAIGIAQRDSDGCIREFLKTIHREP